MAELVEVIFPPEQQEGTESVVGKWLKAIGDQVEINQPLLEISTDKVSVEIAAPATGVLVEILKNENDPVEKGALLGRIDVKQLPQGQSTRETAPEIPSAAPEAALADGELSPAVRKLLREHGLQAVAIKGSGRGGRITHQDVLDHIAKGSGKGLGSQSSGIPSKIYKHDPARRRIAQHMVASLLHTAPHVTTVFHCDLSAVLRDKESRSKESALKGVKLTLTPYFVMACVAAIKAAPEANSRFHDDGLEVFEDMNIGVATAIEGKDINSSSLIVPVIHKAQELDLLELASRLQELTSMARDGGLKPEHAQNGTFTISNHGASGSLFAAPIIINQPQCAILGIGKLEKRPVVVSSGGKDSIEIRPMVYVTLTIDHRALDGYKANNFLSTFVSYLQDL
ncbi:MAG: dihydrolipoamide succinyltransferase [Proteobacteria bacterium]|nr:MAG: dihydrolipoamide succinyltransferase [Pseudomonadota bacterium]